MKVIMDGGQYGLAEQTLFANMEVSLTFTSDIRDFSIAVNAH